MDITFDPTQLRKASARLGRIAQREFPGAVTEALTVVAFRARKAERAMLKDRLDRPRRYTVESAIADPAVRRGKWIQSSLGVLPGMQSILGRLEYGGDLPRGVQVEPEAQDRYGGLGRQGRRRVLRKPGAFETANGIFQRQATGRAKLLVLYLDHAHYTPILRWRATAEEVGATFPDEVRRQLAKRLAR